MYRILLCSAVMLPTIGSLSLAQSADETDEPKTAVESGDAVSPAEQLAALQKEYNDAMREFSNGYRKVAAEARDNEDQAAARKAVQDFYAEKYPNPAKYAGKFLKLAKENPDDAIAVQALVWIIQRASGTEESKAAIELIARDHVESDQLLPIVSSMTRTQPSNETEALLRSILAKNPHEDTQGMAKYVLGKYLAQLSSLKSTLEQYPERAGAYEGRYGKEFCARLMKLTPQDIEAEIESLFEDIATNHGDLSYGRRKLSDIVESELFEIKYLSIGKVAPDIEGEDLDGDVFKLSDYRGKVVVIDFWGDW